MRVIRLHSVSREVMWIGEDYHRYTGDPHLWQQEKTGFVFGVCHQGKNH